MWSKAKLVVGLLALGCGGPGFGAGEEETVDVETDAGPLAPAAGGAVGAPEGAGGASPRGDSGPGSGGVLGAGGAGAGGAPPVDPPGLVVAADGSRWRCGTMYDTANGSKTPLRCFCTPEADPLLCTNSECELGPCPDTRCCFRSADSCACVNPAQLGGTCAQTGQELVSACPA